MIVRIEASDQLYDIAYASIDRCLADEGLRVLFDAQQITSCTIISGDTEIARVPVLTWQRFRGQLIDNASNIYQKELQNDE
jgi:hypothetical protein